MVCFAVLLGRKVRSWDSRFHHCEVLQFGWGEVSEVFSPREGLPELVVFQEKYLEGVVGKIP